jgi:hypothetical protein
MYLCPTPATPVFSYYKLEISLFSECKAHQEGLGGSNYHPNSRRSAPTLRPAVPDCVLQADYSGAESSVADQI